MWHCSKGQDRTAILTALILLMTGVPEQTVAADYARSPDFSREDAVRMERTICHIRGTYGSVEEYVCNVCNVAQDTIDRLRQEFRDGLPGDD